MLGIVAEPSSESGLITGLTARDEASRAYEAEDSMRRHQTPLLLRPMNQAVDQIPVTDALCGLIGELEHLEILLLSSISVGKHRISSQIVFLYHERAEFVVIEIKLNLVVESRVTA